MPFSPEIEAKIEKAKKEAQERWDKMTEQERKEFVETARRFGKKVRSSYGLD